MASAVFMRDFCCTLEFWKDKDSLLHYIYDGLFLTQTDFVDQQLQYLHAIHGTQKSMNGFNWIFYIPDMQWSTWNSIAKVS